LPNHGAKRTLKFPKSVDPIVTIGVIAAQSIGKLTRSFTMGAVVVCVEAAQPAQNSDATLRLAKFNVGER
jgi:hypothetical protein